MAGSVLISSLNEGTLRTFLSGAKKLVDQNNTTYVSAVVETAFLLLSVLMASSLINWIAQPLKFIISNPMESQMTAQYNPRIIFPTEHIFLEKEIVLPGDTDALISKYDDDGNYLILGCKDGSVRVLSSDNQNNTLFTLNPEEQSPVTCLALNPNNKNLKNSLLCTYADGRLGYWHMTSKQLLSMKDTQKMLYCCGFSTNGITYSYAGQDNNVYIEDLGKNNSFSLHSGKLGKHSNRVFCTKWHPDDSNLLYSGGWDETVYFWDVRCKEAINRVYKVTIGGESIDVKNNLLLMGNLQQQYQLKMYDLKAGKLIPIEWNDYDKNKSMVISAAFLNNDRFLAATIMTKEVRMFESNRCVDVFQLSDRPIYSMTVSPTTNQFAVSSGKSKIHIFNY